MIGWATCFDDCHPDVAAFLLSRGARHHVFSAIACHLVGELRATDVNRRMSRNEDHRLPLQFAVRRRAAGAVARLIELGADPLGVDGSGHIAADYAETPAIDRPAMRRSAATEAELVSARRGRRAARLARHDVLAALALGDFGLVERPADELPLMAKRGDVAAVLAARARGEPGRALASLDAEVTALHLAALAGHADVVRILLAHGADPSVHDSSPRRRARPHGRKPSVTRSSSRCSAHERRS